MRRLRNHINNCSPLSLLSQLAHGQRFNCNLIQVGSGSKKKKKKITQSPTRAHNQSLYPMHMLNTCYLCIFMFTERGELEISCQRQMPGWKEEEKAGGSKRNLLPFGWSSVKKRSSAKNIPPLKTTTTKKKNQLNFTVDFSNERYKHRTRQRPFPPENHILSARFCLCLKLKHPWFKVHPVVRGGWWKRGGEGVAEGSM